MSDTKTKEVWVKIDGALTTPDPVEQSRFFIPSPLPHVHDVMAYANHVAGKTGRVVVFGTVCDSIAGERTARSWLLHHDVDNYHELTHQQVPPPDATVIDQWPMKT